MNLDSYFVKNPKFNHSQMFRFVEQKESDFIKTSDNRLIQKGIDVFNKSIRNKLSVFREKNALSFPFGIKETLVSNNNVGWLYNEKEHREVNFISHFQCGRRQKTDFKPTKQGELKLKQEKNLDDSGDFITVNIPGKYEEVFDFSTKDIVKQFLSHFYCHIDNNKNVSIVECNSGNGNLNVPFTMQLKNNNHIIGGNIEIDKYGNFTIVYADNYFSTSMFANNPFSLEQHKKIIDMLEKELSFKFIGNKETPVVLTSKNSKNICTKYTVGPCSLYSVANAILLSDFCGLDMERNRIQDKNSINDDIDFVEKVFKKHCGSLSSKLDQNDVIFVEKNILERDKKNLLNHHFSVNRIEEENKIKQRESELKAKKNNQNIFLQKPNGIDSFSNQINNHFIINNNINNKNQQPKNNVPIVDNDSLNQQHKNINFNVNFNQNNLNSININRVINNNNNNNFVANFQQHQINQQQINWWPYSLVFENPQYALTILRQYGISMSYRPFDNNVNGAIDIVFSGNAKRALVNDINNGQRSIIIKNNVVTNITVIEDFLEVIKKLGIMNVVLKQDILNKIQQHNNPNQIINNRFNNNQQFNVVNNINNINQNKNDNTNNIGNIMNNNIQSPNNLNQLNKNIGDINIKNRSQFDNIPSIDFIEDETQNNIFIEQNEKELSNNLYNYYLLTQNIQTNKKSEKVITNKNIKTKNIPFKTFIKDLLKTVEDMGEFETMLKNALITTKERLMHNSKNNKADKEQINKTFKTFGITKNNPKSLF